MPNNKQPHAFNNSGNSTVFTITFRVIKEGASAPSLTDVKLLASKWWHGRQISHDSRNGFFTIPGDTQGNRDIDLTDLEALAIAYGSAP